MLSLSGDAGDLGDTSLDGDLALPEIDMDSIIPSFGGDDNDQGEEMAVTPLDTGVVEDSGQVMSMDIDAGGVVQDSGTIVPLGDNSGGLGDIDALLQVDVPLETAGQETTQDQQQQQPPPPGEMDMDEDQLDENGEKIPIYLDLSRMQKWRVEDVCEYLKNSQFGAIYVDTFMQQQISGRILYEVDDNRLSEFGVKSAIHRFRILRDIADAKDIARWEQCTQQGGDGGTTLSRYMRLNAEDLSLWCTYITSRQEIGMTLARNKPEVTGYDLIHADDVTGILTAGRVAQSDQHKIVQELNRLKLQNNEALQIVETVWKQRRDPTNQCYFLKPQHLVTPTLNGGRVPSGGMAGANGMQQMYGQQQMGYNQQNMSRQGGGGAAMGVKSQRPANKLIGKKRNRGGTANGDRSNASHSAISNYNGPNVLEWDNATVLTFVSGFTFGDRYLRHFRQLQIDGPTLIKLTANTLEDVVRVTVKTHIRQMCKAIDDLRDMALTEFIERQSTQAWMASNPPKRQRTTASKRSRSNAGSGNVSSSSSSALNAVQQSMVAQDGGMMMGNAAGGYGMGVVGAAGGMATPGGPVPKCQLCGRTDNIMRCSNCKNAFYCSREHQLQDWPQHQAKCVA